MKISLWLLLALAVPGAVDCLAQDSRELPEKICYFSRLGEVVFSHALHAERIAECNLCHHNGQFKKCETCHGVLPEAPTRINALHMQCKGCHREMGMDTACSDCHHK